MNVRAAGATAGALVWVRSTHSNNEGASCVEVAAGAGAVYVRDSKDREGVRLALTAAGWSAFLGFAAGAGH